MNRLNWLHNASQPSILLSILHLMLLSMQSIPSLDRHTSYMDLEELARHMSTTPYATSYVVRERLFYVWLLQASPLFSSLVAGLHIPHSKSPLRSMNPLHVQLPEIQTWLSWFVPLIWWFGMKHQCSIVTSMRQSIGPSKTFATMKNHLEAYQLSLEEISSKYCQSSSKAHVLRSLVPPCKGLIYGALSKFSSSQRIWGWTLKWRLRGTLQNGS